MNKKYKLSLCSGIFIFCFILVLSLFFVSAGGLGDSKIIEKEKQKVQQIIDYDGNLVNKNETYLWKRTSTTEIFKNPDGTYSRTLGQGIKFIDDKTKRYPNYKTLSEVVNMTVTQDGYKIKWYDNEVDIKLKVKEKNEESKEIKEFKTEKVNIDEKRILEDEKDSYHFYWELEDIDAKSVEKIKNTKFKDIEEFEIVIENKTNTKIIQKDNKFILEDGIEINLQDLIDTNYTLETGSENSIKIKPDKTKGKDLDVSTIVLDPTITLQDADTENLDDVFIIDGASNNYGTISLLRIGGQNAERQESFFRFNLSSIEGMSNITYATLNLYANTNWFEGGENVNSSVHRVYQYPTFNISSLEWTELTIKGTNEPEAGEFNATANDFLYFDNNSGMAEWYSWDIANIIQQENNAFSDNVSLYLKYKSGVANNIGDYISFNSKESSSSRPYLNITYTQYIDIISPSPSQTFVEDIPTANLNVSTAVAMGICYWTNDSGTTNYTMSSVNSTYWYNDTAGSLLLDGGHTIEFYCNQSSDGTWRTSESVSFDIDSINITTCRDLTVNRQYELQNNIYGNKDCLTANNNLTIDFNSHILETNNTYKGIIVNLASIITIFDGTIFSGDRGIMTGGTVGYKMNVSNFNITTKNDGDEAIQDASLINIRDSTLDIPSGTVIFKSVTSCSVDAVNISYINSTTNSDTDVIITRKWYLDTTIRNPINNFIENANITIYNSSGILIYSGLTNSTGQIPRQELIEYTNNGTKTLHTPHIINVSKITYATNSTTYNLTTDHNINHSVSLEYELSTTIYHPQAIAYSYNDSLPLNFSYSNSSEVDSCWYNVFNSSNAEIIANTTLINCANSTFSLPSGDIDYTLNLYINQTAGEESDNSVSFNIRTDSPAVNLDYPTNNAYSSSGINTYFNFTATDSNGVDACILYGNFNGTWLSNYTWNPTSGSQNYTILNLTEKIHNWNVWCNDSLGNSGFSPNNFTLYIDESSPILTIDNIQTTAGSQTIQFTNTITDLTPITCKYSIYNSTSEIDGTNENVTFTCNSLTSATVTAYGTYNLTIYANDSVGNENSTTQSFTTIPTPSTPPSGGGGTTIILISPETNWTMESSEGIENFQVSMSILERRKFTIQLENTGESNRSIVLSCEDVNGTACQYVELPNETINLKLLKDTKQTIEFFINLPEDVANEEFQFNIVGTDENGGRRAVTVILNVGGSSFISKVLFSYTSFGLPYLFVFFPVIIFSLFISSRIFNKKVPLRTIWIGLSSLTLAVIVTLVIP